MNYLFFRRHPRIARLVRRLLASELTSVCYMNFVIRFDEGKFPELAWGPPGRELACYIPDDVEWRQLNYGQGEGQVDVSGREWGFYLEKPLEAELCVVLHSGELGTDEALRFVRAVAAKVARSQNFIISMRGDTILREHRC